MAVSFLKCPYCSNSIRKSGAGIVGIAVDCDPEVLWAELKQILHLKVACSDFGPIRDRGSLPYILGLEFLVVRVVSLMHGWGYPFIIAFTHGCIIQGQGLMYRHG